MPPPLTWAILTGEYPPDIGGVSHYTQQIARGLVAAGDTVHIWTPTSSEPPPVDKGIYVHVLPDHYLPRSLMQLQEDLSNLQQPYRLLLQYTGNAFGIYGANYPFALWLAAQRTRPWVMFHELYMPLTRSHPMKYNVLAVAQRLMLALVMYSTARSFVSIPTWGKWLEPFSDGKPIDWLPIPSNLEVNIEAPEVTRTRANYLSNSNQLLVGTFGTYGGAIADHLARIIPPMLRRDPRRGMLLMGRGSAEFCDKLLAAHPELTERLWFTGSLAPNELALHLAACDLLIQPYPDGVSTRRSSLVAGMALGVPTVGPLGFLSEPIWATKRPIILAPEATPEAMLDTIEHALTEPGTLAEFGRRAKAFHEEFLDLGRTIELLRSAE